VSDAPPGLIEPMPSGAIIEEFRRSANFRIHEMSGARARATLSLN